MNTGKILLVHRHSDVRESLKTAFEARGWEVILGLSAASALNILKLEPVQAVFVDLRENESVCLDLIYRMQQARPGVAIFGLADFPSHYEIQSCRNADIQGYFVAPFNINALINALERLNAAQATGQSQRLRLLS